jgi:hypothetical protein
MAEIYITTLTKDKPRWIRWTIYIGLVLLALLLMLIGFAISYRLLLSRFLGGWLDSTLEKIPILGAFMVVKREGLGMADTVSGLHPLYRNKEVDLSLKNVGYGRGCAWDKAGGTDFCNPWNRMGELSEQEKLEDERRDKMIADEEMAGVYRTLQEPVNLRMIRMHGPHAPKTYISVHNKRKEIKNTIENLLRAKKIVPVIQPATQPTVQPIVQPTTPTQTVS